MIMFQPNGLSEQCWLPVPASLLPSSQSPSLCICKFPLQAIRDSKMLMSALYDYHIVKLLEVETGIYTATVDG